MSEEITVREEAAISYPAGYEIIPVEQIKRQTDSIKSLMASCMEDGMHYGKIPGCGNKPTLLQPGAQKLTLMFGLADDYEVKREDLPNGHREYTVKCSLVSKNTGLIQGSGMGLCTTMEKKYRYRNTADFEVTDMPIPEDSKERKQEYRKQGYGMKKVDGMWRWVRYKDGSQQENPDIADTYNTVLKMACKRALVAAVLNTLATSDLFTQDIEDLESYAIDYEQPQQPQQQQKPQRPPEEKKAWAEVAAVKEQALELGIENSEIVNWANEFYGKPMNLFGLEEINGLKAHITELIESRKAQIAQQEEMSARPNPYDNEDIPF